MWIASSLDTVLKPTIAALGNFDGIHRGHDRVIQPILPGSSFAQECRSQECRSQELSTKERSTTVVSQKIPARVKPWGATDATRLMSPRLYSTVITFSPHPQEFFTGQPKALLTLPEEKAARLEALGVEQLIVLPFNRELAYLTPQEFVADLLVDTLQVRGVSVGQDFCFGKGRSGTAADLQRLAALFQVKVNIVPLQYDRVDYDRDCDNMNGNEPQSDRPGDRYGNRPGDRISSSAIRDALAQGEIVTANTLLGYPYSLEGRVITGQQLGRQLGFPTANLQISSQKFLPRSGVYGVQVQILSPDSGTESALLPGVMNLGTRPTVGNHLEQSLEVHLLQWEGDLYGRSLRIYLRQFLRSEQKFSSLVELKAQIQNDCQAAQQSLGSLGDL